MTAISAFAGTRDVEFRYPSASLPAEHVGMYAVVVDAIDETAAAFYQKHSFTPLTDQPLRLFFPIGVGC
ncbi:MAG: hypothetical protein HC938_16200, partial [Nitrospira sp.]|nr:hypothetical protein [Nitrospira sp.]